MRVTEEIPESRKVRLFPSHHIKSKREAEMRATSSFLAIARAVSEFGKKVVSLMGGPSGKLDCYTEVTFASVDESNRISDRPDGLLHVTWGKTEWKAFVEVKVGDSRIEQEQIDRYLKLAKGEHIDALITISNQAALADGQPPVLKIDKRGSVPVRHLSWERLLSEAQMLSQRKEVADPDQKWMLDEWIRYLADDASGIIEQPRLGNNWVGVLRAAKEGRLTTQARQIDDVLRYWDAFLRKLAFRLRAKLGAEVYPKLTKADKDDPAAHLRKMRSTVIQDGDLHGKLKVPGAAGDIGVIVMLPSRMVRYSINIKAPTDRGATARLNWLLRQLRNNEETPRDLIITVHWSQPRIRSQARFEHVVSDLKTLLRDIDGVAIARDALPRSFTLDRTVPVAKAQGRSTIPVLEGIERTMEEFYRHVVEGLKPFVPPAPRLPKETKEAANQIGTAERDRPGNDQPPDGPPPSDEGNDVDEDNVDVESPPELVR